MAVLGFARKRDLVYFIHFCMSIPITFLMDLQAIYPQSLVPSSITSIKNYYIETYNDRFFIDTPLFFKVFMWSEVLFQAPVAVWAVGALRRDDPKLPIVLLPFAMLVFITTLTCVVEMWSWDISTEQKVELSKLYGPYLVLPLFMGVDMVGRLLAVVGKVERAGSVGKKRM